MNNLKWLFETLDKFIAIKPHTVKALERLNISKPLDLLFYLPRKFKKRFLINEPNKELIGEEICINLNIIEITYNKSARISNKNPFKVITETKNRQIIKIIFFNPLPPFVLLKFQNNNNITIIGKLEHNYGVWQIAHPSLLMQKNITEIEPIYPLTFAITNSYLASIIKNVVGNLPELNEWLPENIIDNYRWSDFTHSIRTIHSTNEIEAEERLKCIDRVAFDEMLAYFLALKIAKVNSKKSYKVPKNFTGLNSQKVLEILGFELTEGQNFAIQEINLKLKSSEQAHILLQGDVGSGKTLIALMAALNSLEGKFQVAIMAPTTILAIQHYEFFLQFVDKFNLNVNLLISKTKAKEKREILAKLKDGKIDILIGTHSLIIPEVEFKNLGLVVIDEQHRFGVEQRLQLMQKGNNPDLLAMSATPIPRTLAQTLYSDMQIITMKGKPKNRKEIVTSVHNAENLPHLLDSLERPIKDGKQIYWVCPLIDTEDGEEQLNNESKTSVMDRFIELDKVFPGKVSYIHGKLKEEEKAEIINEFKTGNKQILVATTVIEVGVNIPNASVIIIESAENYGLAQLHQLRGRVGRGDQQSYCILIYNNLTKNGKSRLTMMKETNDGFELAEADLKLRGGGDIVGTRQSGWLQFKIADYDQHYELLTKASKLAEEIITIDKNLANHPEYKILLKLFEYDNTLKYVTA